MQVTLLPVPTQLKPPTPAASAEVSAMADNAIAAPRRVSDLGVGNANANNPHAEHCPARRLVNTACSLRARADRMDRTPCPVLASLAVFGGDFPAMETGATPRSGVEQGRCQNKMLHFDTAIADAR
jgi:hypothetical protein